MVDSRQKKQRLMHIAVHMVRGIVHMAPVMILTVQDTTRTDMIRLMVPDMIHMEDMDMVPMNHLIL